MTVVASPRAFRGCFRFPRVDALSDVNGRRSVFEDIFARVDAAGAARSSLQLAWDFTVGTRVSITSSMLAMREDGACTVGTVRLSCHRRRQS